MLNLTKYAAVAALATGLGVAATKSASAWSDDYDDGYGIGPYADGFTYPYTYYGYRPFHPPRLYGFYGPRPFYNHW